MVFISLEGFLEVSATHLNGKSSASTHSSVAPSPHAHELPKASVHVVVTPGSPAKPSAPASSGQKRSRLRRAASSLSGFSTITRRNSSGTSPTNGASVPDDQFVLYVTDRDVHHKWVLAKTPSDYFQLKKSLQSTVTPCRTFACCGPLRRIVHSSQYNKPKRRWSDSRVVTQFVRSNVIQEYINDLLLAVLGRDAECDSTKQAWETISTFLDVEKQRTQAADQILLHTIGDMPGNQVLRRSGSERPSFTRRPSIVFDRHAVILHDEDANSPTCVNNDPGSDHCETDGSSVAECSICCCEFTGAGKTSRLLCGHKYHTDCVRVWLRMHHTCPVCRIPIEGA